MAAAFLAASGIDLDAEMARVQFGKAGLNMGPGPSYDSRLEMKPLQRVTRIANVSLPCAEPNTHWDVNISGSQIESIVPHDPGELDSSNSEHVNGHGALLAPSLCHPHVHLDKAFLLSHPKYAHLQIEEGTFDEAMKLTGEAKASFEHDDLLERGDRLVDESVQAGVTAMRAFVEVDPIVGMKCLEAGKMIKKSNADRERCDVQICAFAQLPIFSGEDDGEEIRSLMQKAAATRETDVVGSTPYVEDDRNKMEKNVEWMIDLALKEQKHLDFHLDYNLDPETQPLVWHVIDALKAKDWIKHTNKTIVFGHCSRLSLFKDAEWKKLRSTVGDLPISFVGLPTSDLFMMRTENGARGTLPIPKLIKEYGFNAAIGINNIGNAFTPQGCCDPLSITSLGIGLYQAGTKQDAELLYECVSTRARAAIGLSQQQHSHEESADALTSLQLTSQRTADLVLFPRKTPDWHTRHSVSEAIYLYDGANNRIVVKSGFLLTD